MRDSVERMMALDPEAVYLTHFSRRTPPRPLAAEMLRRMDDCVKLTLAAVKTAAGADPLPAIRAALADYLLEEARSHGVALSDAEILEIWRMDLDLDAQGLAVWATAGK
jgi:hypothetical protein